MWHIQLCDPEPSCSLSTTGSTDKRVPFSSVKITQDGFCSSAGYCASACGWQCLSWLSYTKEEESARSEQYTCLHILHYYWEMTGAHNKRERWEWNLCVVHHGVLKQKARNKANLIFPHICSYIAMRLSMLKALWHQRILNGRGTCWVGLGSSLSRKRALQ